MNKKHPIVALTCFCTFSAGHPPEVTLNTINDCSVSEVCIMGMSLQHCVRVLSHGVVKVAIFHSEFYKNSTRIENTLANLIK